MNQYNGSCRCGAIHYSFSDEPINSIFCYCKECQACTGSDKWFGLWVPTAKFKFTKGSPALFSRIGDSGKEIKHSFCVTCGTNLCAEVTVGNFYSVAATTIIGDHKFPPKMAIYTASAPEWTTFPEGVQKFEILPPDTGA